MLDYCWRSTKKETVVRAFTRKNGKSGQGTPRKGGGIQFTTCLDASTLERINRLAAKNGLSTATLIRELTKTGLRLAETGNPWREQ